jgi:hypothetical protein
LSFERDLLFAEVLARPLVVTDALGFMTVLGGHSQSGLLPGHLQFTLALAATAELTAVTWSIPKSDKDRNVTNPSAMIPVRMEYPPSIGHNM